jgi:intraflagellar transport protein 80
LHKFFYFYSFSCKQLGHPALFDLRDMSMSLIVQAEKYREKKTNVSMIIIWFSFRYFLLSDGINITIYSYEGRLVSTPKLMSSKPDSVNVNTVSISPDTIAVRDATDTKCKSI